MDKKEAKKASEIQEARENLPGAAENAADNNSVNPALVKERTRTINNNPRNGDGPQHA